MSPARRRFALGLTLCGLLACGGDDDGPGQVSVQADPPMDAAVVAVPDANISHDAGDDTPVPDSGPADDAAEPIPCDAEACAAISDACNVGACSDVTGECEVRPRDDGTPCGDATSTECSGPDICNAGACVANDPPSGTPCGLTGVVCRIDDQCDGGGQCVTGNLAPEGSACGSQLDGECDDPDTCDAFGACQPNHAGVDQQCGHSGVLCHHDDYCDGSGNCDVQGPWNISTCPAGHPVVSGLGCSCGSPSDDESCTPKICVDGACQMLDATGSCVP